MISLKINPPKTKRSPTQKTSNPNHLIFEHLIPSLDFIQEVYLDSNTLPSQGL